MDEYDRLVYNAIFAKLRTKMQKARSSQLNFLFLAFFQFINRVLSFVLILSQLQNFSLTLLLLL